MVVVEPSLEGKAASIQVKVFGADEYDISLDFGDASLIHRLSFSEFQTVRGTDHLEDSPVLVSTFTHTYSVNGFYDVRLNISNQVSDPKMGNTTILFFYITTTQCTC